ncbi:MAG: MoxR family ATPase, partial [Planctomycetales bacterium]
QGPIFAQVLLIDEINRSTPKTQSALLEGLEEFEVTVANQSYPLPDPFFAIATQSPGDPEGTFPFPEIQLDRFFFKLRIPFPSVEDVEMILDRTTESHEPAVKKVLTADRVMEMAQLVREVKIAPEVRRYAVRLMIATHPDHESATPAVKRFVAHGASPRGAQAIVMAGKVQAILQGRMNVAAEDLHRAATPALRHRISLNFEGQGEGADPDDLVREILETVKPG